MNRPVMIAIHWLLGIFLGLLLACSATTPRNEAAIQVVKDFVQAWEAGDIDTLLILLEPAEWRREIGPEIRLYTQQLRQVTFRNPTYTLVDTNNDQAHVRLTSSLDYTLRDGTARTHDIDVVIVVVKIDQAWYIRTVDYSRLFQ